MEVTLAVDELFDKFDSEINSRLPFYQIIKQKFLNDNVP